MFLKIYFSLIHISKDNNTITTIITITTITITKTITKTITMIIIITLVHLLVFNKNISLRAKVEILYVSVNVETKKKQYSLYLL